MKEAPPFLLEQLSDGHDRKAFQCGQDPLDRYLRMQATQDMRRNLATCFVAIENSTGVIAAYYTLSSASIPMLDLPPEITKKLPRYPSLPAIRIGRLAVDLAFRGRGLGAALLADAVRRAMLSPAASFALLVDAKDDAAVAFYRHHGFEPLINQPRTLFLAVAAAVKRLC